jgi:hypothetical protein
VAVSGRDVRNDSKARGIEEMRDLEDSMECGEEMSEDTHTTVECQPLLKLPPEDMGAKTKEGMNRNEREEGRSWVVGGADRALTQPDEDGRTGATLSSFLRRK